MVYLGRVVGVGLTREGDGNPCAVYAVSGRSAGSQARKLDFEGNFISFQCRGRNDLREHERFIPPVVRTAKFIPPHFSKEDREKCEKMWAEQEENLKYKAMRTAGDGDVLVVTNGYQTDEIADDIEKSGVLDPGDDSGNVEEVYNSIVKRVLARLGPEPDPSRTARITGVIDPLGPPFYFGLGIVTPKGAASHKVPMNIGFVRYIATYQDNPSTAPLVGPELDTLGKKMIKMDGITPKDLAAEFMEWAAKQKDGKVEVICSAAAVWSDAELGWEFAVKNLWE